MAEGQSIMGFANKIKERAVTPALLAFSLSPLGISLSQFASDPPPAKPERPPAVQQHASPRISMSQESCLHSLSLDEHGKPSKLQVECPNAGVSLQEMGNILAGVVKKIWNTSQASFYPFSQITRHRDRINT